MKIKRLGTFLLAMIMIAPMFLFTGCDAYDELPEEYDGLYLLASYKRKDDKNFTWVNYIDLCSEFTEYSITVEGVKGNDDVEIRHCCRDEEIICDRTINVVYNESNHTYKSDPYNVLYRVDQCGTILVDVRYTFFRNTSGYKTDIVEVNYYKRDTSIRIFTARYYSAAEMLNKLNSEFVGDYKSTTNNSGDPQKMGFAYNPRPSNYCDQYAFSLGGTIITNNSYRFGRVAFIALNRFNDYLFVRNVLYYAGMHSNGLPKFLYFDDNRETKELKTFVFYLQANEEERPAVRYRLYKNVDFNSNISYIFGNTPSTKNILFVKY